MKEIATLLINYGFDFEYQNRNSHGESITLNELSVKVINSQGEFMLETFDEINYFKDDFVNIQRIVKEIEKILIKETN